MALAGIVTCGFAVVYNTPWVQAGLATVGGMLGHGLRYLALGAGSSLEVATFVGCLAVGALSGRIARSGKVPVAVIAFAGAVTMMPGLHIYRAFAGARQMARLTNNADPLVTGATLGNAFEACLVVGGLVLGLVLGTRLTSHRDGDELRLRSPSALRHQRRPRQADHDDNIQASASCLCGGEKCRMSACTKWVAILGAKARKLLSLTTAIFAIFR